MLNALESCLIIAVSVALALVSLFAFRRFWLPRAHRQHNDVIGWQVAFLGTTYAVIIAFMLAGVWQKFEAAQTNAENESNALLNIYRLAAGFPARTQEQLHSLSRRYAELMLRDEWPAMQRGDPSPEAATQTAYSLWQAITGAEVRNAAEQAYLERALTDLADLMRYRRIRHLNSRSGLPVLFWVLLITGGAMTVLYTCLFDVEDARMHVLQVVGVTLVVSLVLVTIADVDGPYAGAVRIQPTGFGLALEAMNARPR